MITEIKTVCKKVTNSPAPNKETTPKTKPRHNPGKMYLQNERILNVQNIIIQNVK